MSNNSWTPSSDIHSTSASARSETTVVAEPEDELAALFAWIPPTLGDARQDTCSEAQVISPSLPFFDKHIDKSRILKRVVHNSAIRRALCTTVNDALTFFKANDINFPPVNSEYSLFESASNRTRVSALLDQSGLHAEDVQNHYLKTVGISCVPVASGLFLKSHFPHWFHLLTWHSTGERPPNHVKGTSIEDLQVSLDINFLSPHSGPVTTSSQAMERLRKVVAGTKTETILKRVNSRFQHLLTFKALPPFPESDAFLRDMGVLCNQDAFSWEDCHTTGFPAQGATILPHSVDHEWESVLAVNPVPTQIAVLKSSKKRGGGGETSHSVASSKASVTPSLPKRQNPRQTRIKVLSSFVQRAWAEAVDKDTSFILFRSGGLERIAMRERSTQTLHLSELYSVQDNEGGLSYTKMHVGLFIAAINDASGRAESLESLESTFKARIKTHARPRANLPSKRHTNTFFSVAKRRQNLSSGNAPILTRSRQRELRILDDVGRRNLLLVTLCFGNFNSPAPVSMFRTGRAQGDYDGPDPATLPTRSRNYSETEYISISLGTSIGKGATGAAHPGTLTAVLSDGTCQHAVVVKLAFNQMQRTRLRHEYRVYERLIGAGVNNVLRVWGLFENDSEFLSVLVLEPGGQSLRHLKSQREMLDPRDCTSFYKILADINGVGVTHGDLRPENLLVDKEGRPTIIDFDLATMTEDKTPAPSEAGLLKTMFEVYYKEKNG